LVGGLQFKWCFDQAGNIGTESDEVPSVPGEQHVRAGLDGAMCYQRIVCGSADDSGRDVAQCRYVLLLAESDDGQAVENLPDDGDGVRAGNPGPYRQAGQNGINFAERSQCAEGVLPGGFEEDSCAGGVVNMKLLKRRNQDGGIEESFQERLPSTCWDRSSRERRMASSMTTAGSAVPTP